MEKRFSLHPMFTRMKKQAPASIFYDTQIKLLTKLPVPGFKTY